MAEPIYEAYSYKGRTQDLISRLRREKFGVIEDPYIEFLHRGALELEFIAGLSYADFLPIIVKESYLLERDIKTLRKLKRIEKQLILGFIDNGFKVYIGDHKTHRCPKHQRCLYVNLEADEDGKLRRFARNLGE